MSSKSSSCGTSTLSVLQIIFIVLKLLKVITWSWWKVFIPTWIGLGSAIIYYAIMLMIWLYYRFK